MEFKFKARSPEGKIVEGVIQGDSQDAAVATMRERGMMPITLTRSGREKGGESFREILHRMGSVPLRDKVIFFRQLATMIKAGVTLGNALNILVDQTKNPRLADSIRRVKMAVDGGFSLSGALRTRAEFSTLMVSIVSAGEEGGKLDESLDRLATFLERQDELRRKIVSAVTYPAVVILFAFFILYILVTVVMPRFSQVFRGLNVPLPTLTVQVFNFSEWMAEFWYIPLLAVLLFGVAVSMLAKNKDTKPAMDAMKLRLPMVGDIFFKSAMARSNRTLASLVDSGVPILKSLEMTAEVTDNAVIGKAYTSLRDAARKGASLGDTAKNIPVFPVMIAHMMKVGEETGQLETMLDKVAGWFEMELDEKIKRLTSILEPVLIIFVGGIVALVALAIFTPIVTAIQTMM
ncbi:type IV pilus assembly protein PilC [Aminivibrio pyruvatiphilus]|uniref:Type IV pilus assembly protein PilC n=1 Tax=Aminivibrio pyruvatiphilus TaxID=1005740 RepID=A0A4R8LZB6_9BACT|nr:type II secretion system F family protein [Aminivibrio pyruvatiphilus]TDY52064.1 type IV pilus assembly protein PilC [Aminivibrio pyruvatiphilus]